VFSIQVQHFQMQHARVDSMHWQFLGTCLRSTKAGGPRKYSSIISIQNNRISDAFVDTKP